jgi:hypothetical protein
VIGVGGFDLAPQMEVIAYAAPRAMLGVLRVTKKAFRWGMPSEERVRGLEPLTFSLGS